MVKRLLVLAALAIILVPSVAVCGDNNEEQPAELLVQGKVVSGSGNPVHDAKIELFRNGEPYEITDRNAREKEGFQTGKNGLFAIEIFPAGRKDLEAQWSIQATKPGFKKSKSHSLPPPREAREGLYSTTAKVTLARKIGPAYFTALAVLIMVYFLIATELVHRATAALAGASLLLFITHTVGHFYPSLEILSFHQALRSVDWNVIFLLMGMMILVAVLKESGIFQWLAFKAFQISRGRVFALSSILCLVTAVASAFLDNVTTMLLLTPVSLNLANVLGLAPMSLLLPQVLAANFGGAATLIGDPPNIMIGSYSGLAFNDFLVNLGPVVTVTLLIQILYSKWYFGYKDKDRSKEDIDNMIRSLHEKYRITNYRLLLVTGAVLFGVMALFVMHEFLEMEVSVAALFGAALALILTGRDLPYILEHEVEWPSLVFFIMLFVVVAGAQETGILETVATAVQVISQQDIRIAILVVLWTAAIASAIVDNIPFTATMLPVIASLTDSIPAAQSGILWWALALGACFGGNGSLVGASANVVTADMAERNGNPISFVKFAKYGAPMTVLSMIISSLYLIFVWR
jgi:Na+/H+ antiporter NhaD/arsenite permease-like protein